MERNSMLEQSGEQVSERVHIVMSLHYGNFSYICFVQRMTHPGDGSSQLETY